MCFLWPRLLAAACVFDLVPFIWTTRIYGPFLCGTEASMWTRHDYTIELPLRNKDVLLFASFCGSLLAIRASRRICRYISCHVKYTTFFFVHAPLGSKHPGAIFQEKRATNIMSSDLGSVSYLCPTLHTFSTFSFLCVSLLLAFCPTTQVSGSCTFLGWKKYSPKNTLLCGLSSLLHEDSFCDANTRCQGMIVA